jgi:hypothetical protein
MQWGAANREQTTDEGLDPPVCFYAAYLTLRSGFAHALLKVYFLVGRDQRRFFIRFFSGSRYYLLHWHWCNAVKLRSFYSLSACMMPVPPRRLT